MRIEPFDRFREMPEELPEPLNGSGCDGQRKKQADRTYSSGLAWLTDDENSVRRADLAVAAERTPGEGEAASESTNHVLRRSAEGRA
jgi:hypothetical protein